jgi:hypothetical protein
MKVQRVRIPDQARVTPLVIDDDYLPICPIQEYLFTTMSPREARRPLTQF